MSLQDKETAHLKIDPDKYKEGYDRIFNKEAAEELSRIEPLSVKGHSLKQIEKPFVEQKLDLVAHCEKMHKRIEELENLLNESQTARFGLTLQVTELKKKLGETFNDCI